MNKSELIQQIANKSGLSQKQAGEALNALTHSIAESLAKGETVQLVGFGTFGVKQRKARNGKNPQTGETIFLQAKNTPYFKAGKGLKDSVK